MAAPLSADVCKQEIEELHDFFVTWYCGRCDEAEFDRFASALAPTFERVAPDGSVADREAVLAGVRDTYDEYEHFEIEIRNVEPVSVDSERALVRYDEHQTTPSGTNARRSSVVLTTLDDRGTAGPHASWQYLHETWFDPPEK